MKLNTKTLTGVGVGLLAGFVLFKKKPLGIIVTGLAGGLLANFVLNRDKKTQIETKTTQVDKETKTEEKSNMTSAISNDKPHFEIANVTETSPKNYFDIDLGFNN